MGTDEAMLRQCDATTQRGDDRMEGYNDATGAITCKMMESVDGAPNKQI